jgi:hypothetical protein
MNEATMGTFYDGTLTIYKKAAEETSRFYAILDRTNRTYQ